MNKIYVVILNGNIIKTSLTDPASADGKEIHLTDAPTNPIGKLSIFKVKTINWTDGKQVQLVEYDVKLGALQG